MEANTFVMQPLAINKIKYLLNILKHMCSNKFAKRKMSVNLAIKMSSFTGNVLKVYTLSHTGCISVHFSTENNRLGKKLPLKQQNHKFVSQIAFFESDYVLAASCYAVYLTRQRLKVISRLRENWINISQKWWRIGLNFGFFLSSQVCVAANNFDYSRTMTTSINVNP